MGERKRAASTTPQWARLRAAFDEDWERKSALMPLTDAAMQPPREGAWVGLPPVVLSPGGPPTLHSYATTVKELRRRLAERIGEETLRVLERHLGPSKFVLAGGAIAVCFAGTQQRLKDIDLFWTGGWGPRGEGDASKMEAAADTLMTDLLQSTSPEYRVLPPAGPYPSESTLTTLKETGARVLAYATFRVYRTANCLTICLPGRWAHHRTRDRPPIQVILRCFSSVASVLQSFDLPAACMAYLGGGQFAGTPLGHLAYRHRVNVVDLRRSKGPRSYAIRLYRYLQRGFGVALPGTTHSRLQEVVAKGEEEGRGEGGGGGGEREDGFHEMGKSEILLRWRPLAEPEMRLNFAWLEERRQLRRGEAVLTAEEAAAAMEEETTEVEQYDGFDYTTWMEQTLLYHNLRALLEQQQQQQPQQRRRLVALVKYNTLVGPPPPPAGFCHIQPTAPPRVLRTLILNLLSDRVRFPADRTAFSRLFPKAIALQLDAHLSSVAVTQTAAAAEAASVKLSPFLEERLRMPPSTYTTEGFFGQHPMSAEEWYGALHVPGAWW